MVGKLAMMGMGFWLALGVVPARAGATPDPDRVRAAVEALPGCQNFVRFDDAYVYLGFGGYRQGLESPRKARPSELLIASLDDPSHPERLGLKDSGIDAIRDGNTLYVLTYSGIEEWDLKSRSRTAIHSTYDDNGVLNDLENPTGFARYRDELVISHGRLGVTIYDLAEKRVVWKTRLLEAQAPLESAAVDVAVQGTRAYLLMDNITLTPPGTQAPLRGLVVLDLETRRIVAELAGMDPGADALVTDGRRALVSYSGEPVWKYAFSAWTGARLAKPSSYTVLFPGNGHPIGKPAMDAKNVYSCFVQLPEKPGGPRRVRPRAFSRSELKLDQ